ncbi:MAG TPA: NADH-ubiquinone oxidoreductase-F iron-sulfur binding region domain-containing protein [Candidatus Gastranaerophilales bacterium]|nr:NADH-ubiquinone oxidoreductase-F iron-sulfur binding region domain-containing protein [Candidatus Gastranaerophilales bacterium]
MFENITCIKIGMSSCGVAAGAEELYQQLSAVIKEKKLPVELKKVGCLGICYAEPLIEVKTGDNPAVIYRNVNIETALEILENKIPSELVIDEDLEIKNQKRIVLKNCGKIDPEKIEDYIQNKGYQAIKKAILELKEEKIIEEIKKSGLRGRGGAGYPTWLKWKATKEVISLNNDGKFVICNGDEGDPGAYMDRSILEGDPHSVIEGMMIAGFATGAAKGFFYIRAEYPLAVDRVQKAIDQCYDRNLLGEKIHGSDFNFDLEIRLGAGAFVCGEETALISSIEGKRGYPRPRPPFPSIKGLWDKPTVINNVETLANTPYIILNGGDEYAKTGTDKSKGTKVFALTGKVKKPGLIEVPMGTTLRTVIEEIGGGIQGNKKFKAVQTGGPSGGIIPEKYLDTPISYESLQELGSIMGSGGMIVMDEDDCAVDIAKFFTKFCVDESCGKCAPCRIGTIQTLKILEKLTNGEGAPEDIDKLKTICHSMEKASLCGLGQTAPKPVLSSIRYFEDEYLEHIKEKTCRAGKCSFLKQESVEK